MNQRDLINALSEIPEELEILESEHEIPPAVHERYITYHEQTAHDRFFDEKVLQEEKLLFQKEIPLEEKRRILFLLAHIENLESYNTIKNYLQNPEKELLEWAILCFQECRMHLQSYLLEKPQGMIGVGAGGKNGKLRCYFVLSKKEKTVFTAKQKKILKEEFLATAKKLRCEIEEMKFGKYWILLKALMPIDAAVAELAEKGIRACNRQEDFLRFHYYANNVQKPDEKMIEEYLEEIR